jgi:hypothetical protein
MEAPALREKYELELVPIAIGGKRLHFYSITNWDVFVDHLALEGEAYIKNFPFWVKIWEGSVALADDLSGTQRVAKGVRQKIGLESPAFDRNL